MPLETVVLNQIRELELDIEAEDINVSIISNNKVLSKFISKITNELNKFYNFDVTVDPIEDEDDKSNFYLEISAYLQEIGCPYKCLTEGPSDVRYESEKSRFILLSFLLSLLQSARIMAAAETSRSPDQDRSSADAAASLLYQPPAQPASTDGATLTSIARPALIILGLSKVPSGVTIPLFFGKLMTLLKTGIPTLPKHFLGNSLMKQVGPLADDKWRAIGHIVELMNVEYSGRRDKIIQRFDVTIQSFKWSEKGKKESKRIDGGIQVQRRRMSERSHVTLAQLLAARDNPYSVQLQVSGNEARRFTACALNKFRIGAVPDRGGRAREMEAPPPEMPGFMKRDNSAPVGGSGNFRGGGRGGFQGNRGGGGDRPSSGYRGNNDRGRGGGSRGGYQQNQTPNQYGSNNQMIRTAQAVAPDNYYNNQRSGVNSGGPGPAYVPQFQQNHYRGNQRNQRNNYY